ncbi:MAG TPA: FtsX-like permease family protein [Bradyrhizobium sp.]|nr:FtsX-like permease family protein [Bradyrhizobium sp.]
MFLALGAIVGVAASVIIMNLLVGYFSVASDAYINVHPHILIHGSWSAAESDVFIQRLLRTDRRIAMAAPAFHFNRTITLASVNVLTDLCDRDTTAENNCSGKRDIQRAIRAYAFDVIEQKQVEVEIRGISVRSDDTVANYRSLISGPPDFGRLSRTRDSGGNYLPTAFIAQDTLVGDIAGTYLISSAALAPTYDHYYRLNAVIRLGAKSSGDPLLILGLEQAKQLAPPELTQPNVIEVRLSLPLAAEEIVKQLQPALGPGLRYETWIDKERSAFQFLNATWVMVFAVMLSICLVVAISVYSTLTLSILRNSWKVALLGSLGYTPLRVGMVFVMFAVSVALVGIGGGVLLGHFLSYWIGGALYGGVLGLPPERFAASVTLRPAAWMSLATLAIFFASAIIPVRRAVTIRPAEALRGLT